MTICDPGRSYKAKGITLKSSPMGESDRLLTFLTQEYGLVRAVAPGARKPKSSLRAISSPFVVSDLLLVKGRNLDRLVQAECTGALPGLSRDLGKLTAAQYLAELAMGQALSHCPQEELFAQLRQHLTQLSTRSSSQTLPYLVHGILTFLVLAGIAPQFQRCCVSQRPFRIDLADPTWRVTVDLPSGGAIAPGLALNPEPAASDMSPSLRSRAISAPSSAASIPLVAEPAASYTPGGSHEGHYPSAPQPGRPTVDNRAAVGDRPVLDASIQTGSQTRSQANSLTLDALQLTVMQGLVWLAHDTVHGDSTPYAPGNRIEQGPDSRLPPTLAIETLLNPTTLADYLSQVGFLDDDNHETNGDGDGDGDGGAILMSDRLSTGLWLTLESVLRQYAQYHFEQPIRSAALIRTCFPETHA